MSLIEEEEALRKLTAEPDVIVLAGSVKWADMAGTVREAILERVRNGTGLIWVDPIKASLLPDASISSDDERCEWIYINKFPLPSNFQQETSRLLLVLPGITFPITCSPQCCFLDGGLAGKNGLPIVFPDHGGTKGPVLFSCNRIDLFFEQWAPTQDIRQGDNLGTVLKKLYDKLKSMKENQ